MGGGELAKIRRAEAQEAGRRFGVEYTVLDNHDGELMPTLENRIEVIREIRKWNADVVIAPRPNDYHPDHRYTGILVQDAAYMVIVPNVAAHTPPLKKNPVFLYSEDGFQKPSPFEPDIAVIIDAVFEQKIYAMNFWICKPTIFDKIESEFRGFLSDEELALKSELYIPKTIQEMLQAGEIEVKVVPSGGEWFGVTYASDREIAVAELQNKTEKGQYISPLWPKR